LKSSKDFKIWNYKPWWCQPWSILLTGILGIVTCWLITKNIWITTGLSIVIVAWWTYFLIFYPRLIKAMLSQELINQTSKT